VPWLGTRQAVATLPSVASLKALRGFAKKSLATRPLLGVGNPLLEGRPGHDPEDAVRAALAVDRRDCGRHTATEVALQAKPGPTYGFKSVFRGAYADVAKVREWKPLPETASELCEVARRLGVPDGDILLGSRASEGAIKDLSASGKLMQYQILHFATHGALSGEVDGSAEPGLILTPPDPRAGPADLERDDGYLTASEIAGLKLDASWVILSACNTAAGTDEHAEALSGLARAFFYAGARALLVSHWEVGSDVAVRLTTHAFRELQARPEIGRSEAFRLSMREAIENGRLWQAHPSQWAPFVLVGEGGARR
jgi:CHAT domain-containing protein